MLALYTIILALSTRILKLVAIFTKIIENNGDFHQKHCSQPKIYKNLAGICKNDLLKAECWQLNALSILRPS
jgi:hypothetical protein